MVGNEPLNHFLVEPAQPHCLHAVVQEGFPHQREEGLHDLLAERERVASNLFLGMAVHAEGEEVEQVVQVDLPVGLGVRRERKILAGLLAGDARLKPLLVDRSGAVVKVGFGVREAAAGFAREQAGRALPVVRGLRPPCVGLSGLH
jgi:hypothetical protein